MDTGAVLKLFLVVTFGVTMLFVIPEWMVNFDGSGYLALGANIRDLVGYAAPDGSATTFRGPGYPLLIAASWLFGGYSSGVAIVASRVVLVIAGVLASLLAFSVTRSRIAGVATGLIFFSQPILLFAGVMFFAPDGLGAALMLTALALLLMALRRPEHTWFLVVTGAFVSAAFITKESHVLVMIGVGLWLIGRDVPFRDRLRQLGLIGLGFSPVYVAWAVYGLQVSGVLPGELPALSGVAAIIAVMGVPLLSLGLVLVAPVAPDISFRIPLLIVSIVSFGLVTIIATSDVPDVDRLLAAVRGTGGLLSTQAYPGLTALAAAGLVGLAVLGWRTMLDRHAADLFVVVASGAMGLLVFSVYAGTSVRNVVLLPMVLSVLAGASLVGEGRTRLTSVLAIGVLALGIAAMVSVSGRVDVSRLTAEASPTVGAAAWIAERDPDASLAGTPMYFQSSWRLGSRQDAVTLVPMYVGSRNAWDSDTPSFSRAYGWLAKPPREPRRGQPLVSSVGRLEVSAVYSSDLVEVASAVRYLFLAGNTRFPSSPADGGLLLLALVDQQSLEPVFVQHENNAQWVVILEVKGPLAFEDVKPIFVYPGEKPPSDESSRTNLGIVEYANAVTQVLGTLQTEG